MMLSRSVYGWKMSPVRGGLWGGYCIWKPGAAPKKGIWSDRTIALTSLMSKWHATCVILRLAKKKEPEGWKHLHVAGLDGISCQHLQVLMTQLLQKHWEWQEDTRKNRWHGSEKRPTMYFTSMDSKTAFDAARPKHIAKVMGDPEVHGWMTAALSREMTGLGDQTTFENVVSTFRFSRCLRQGGVEAPRLWIKMTMRILWNVEPEWKRRKDGTPHWHLSRTRASDLQHYVWTENFWFLSHPKTHLEQMMKDLIEEVERMGPGTKTSKSEMDKHLCWREDGRHKDQDANRTAQNSRSRTSSRFWDSSSIKRSGNWTAWTRGCRVQTRSDGETWRSAEIKTYRGEWNAEEWWNKSTVYSASDAKACPGVRAILERIKVWESKTWDVCSDSKARRMKDFQDIVRVTQGFEAAFLSETIVGSMWKVMEWTCDTRPNAILTTLKYAFAWRSTAWWQNTKSKEYDGWSQQSPTIIRDGSTNLGGTIEIVCGTRLLRSGQ